LPGAIAIWYTPKMEFDIEQWIHTEQGLSAFQALQGVHEFQQGSSARLVRNFGEDIVQMGGLLSLDSVRDIRNGVSLPNRGLQLGDPLRFLTPGDEELAQFAGQVSDRLIGRGIIFGLHAHVPDGAKIFYATSIPDIAHYYIVRHAVNLARQGYASLKKDPLGEHFTKLIY
jgi:hypothetical protein